jgi:hypothetical protein
MSIRSAIKNSKNDLDPFASKSYADLNFNFEEVKLIHLNLEDQLTEAEQRLLSDEHAKQGSEVAYRVYSKDSGLISVRQFKDIFDDLGFNVDVFMSDFKKADITMSYNFGGYLIPKYRLLVNLVAKIKPTYKKLLLRKLAPGKQRLHARAFHNTDGSWLVVAHVDEANWFNLLNPVKMLRSHTTEGAGDYKTGNRLLKHMLKKTVEMFNNKERLEYDI